MAHMTSDTWVALVRGAASAILQTLEQSTHPATAIPATLIARQILPRLADLGAHVHEIRGGEGESRFMVRVWLPWSRQTDDPPILTLTSWHAGVWISATAWRDRVGVASSSD